MRRHLRLVPLLTPVMVVALTASACGGGTGEDTASTASPSASASTSTSPSPTASTSPSPSGQPTSTAPGEPAPVPAGAKVALDLAPADQAQVPKGGCRPDRKAGLVCSPDRKNGYRFQPDAVRRAGVAAVGARQQESGDWVVDITLGPAGTTALASVTQESVKTRQLILVMVPTTGRVLVAAQVNTRITDGNVQVSGNFTEARARRIVKQITRTTA